MHKRNAGLYPSVMSASTLDGGERDRGESFMAGNKSTLSASRDLYDQDTRLEMQVSKLK